MKVLVDTCVLLRAFDKSSEQRDDILNGLRYLLDQEANIFVAVQNIAEFWNVATRPIENNGMGLECDLVKTYVDIVERFTQVVAENTTSFQRWKSLVRELRVKGTKVHDARIASLMLANDIGTILTLNVDDFVRFADLEVLEPSQLLAESV